jgi:uncharacterized protein involved in outer membrane biogenesis
VDLVRALAEKPPLARRGNPARADGVGERMSDTVPSPRRRFRIWPILGGALVVAITALVLLWNWDWFIPLVQTQASNALGRRVTIAHLHVKLGRMTTVSADDVIVANPDGFPQADPFARIGRLTVVASVMDYIHGRHIVLPSIAVDHPHVTATALSDGRNNFVIKPAATPPTNAKPAPPPTIGDVRIIDGTALVTDTKLKSNMALTINTRAASATTPEAIVVTADGKYAGQKVTGQFTGGALLTLRDAAHPYPIDLRLANGPTTVSMIGTVENPLNFAGARVKLRLAGPDMALLYPLTGVPIPPTPPFSISGNVDYVKPRIRFTDFAGRVGSSDLEGTITEDPGVGGKPDVTMDLRSHRVDLTDLGGFIGTPAGKTTTPGETAAQKRSLEHAAAKKTLLPTQTFDLPRLRAANIHLKYHGERIENRYVPFDQLIVDMDVVDGRITLHPLDFTVGTRGQIVANVDLNPDTADVLHTKADINFHHLELARLMQATHAFHGQGVIGGEARLDTTGNSVAKMMGNGDGELKLVLLGGGNVSALLVDLSGLEFGNALLSALGVPNRATLECFVTDMPLRRGQLDAKVLLADTSEGRITGKGDVDFSDQMLNLSITTRSKSFSIGSLPGPIDITGPLGAPSIRPGTEVVARAGAAVGLGILLTPLGALLPTIQFGVGDDNACTHALAEEHQRLPSHTTLKRHLRGASARDGSS